MGEWQDISTAPKDGTAVLLCIDGDVIGEAYWYSYTDREQDQGWWWANTGPGDYHADRISIVGPHPAFWMPLPAPPKQD